jgi:hypothetical protein
LVTYNRRATQPRRQIARYAGALKSGPVSSVWFPRKPSAWVVGCQAIILQEDWGRATNWVGEFTPEISRTLRRKNER